MLPINQIVSSYTCFPITGAKEEKKTYFRKNDHGAEARSDFPDEAGISGEPLDVALIAAIEEDGAEALRAHPVLGVDEVPLRESRELREAEVIESLREVSGFVLVFLLLLMTMIVIRGL